MFDLARVGKQIKKYRIAADMTQMELAEKMGISFQASVVGKEMKLCRIYPE